MTQISTAVRLGALAGLLFAGDVSGESSFPNGNSSGDITQASAVLWARSTVPGKVKFKVYEEVKHGRASGAAEA